MLHSSEFFQTLILIVKPVPHLPRIRAICIAALLGALLAGCGQRGPLYLPKPPAPLSTAPAPATQSAKPVTFDSAVPPSK
jgi:predicted small lipoprotein YifL